MNKNGFIKLVLIAIMMTTFGIQAAVISNITPGEASPGTIVTIEGTGFGNNPHYVTFNGLAVARENLTWTNAQIQVPVPEHGVSGPVRVVLPGGSYSNARSFKIIHDAGNRSPFGGAEILQGPGLAGGTWAVAQDGQTAYVLTGPNGPAMIVLDLSTEPFTRINTVYLPAGGSEIKLFDDLVLVAGNQGLWVFTADKLQSGNPNIEPESVFWGFNVYAADIAASWEVSPDYPYDAVIALTEWGNSSLSPRVIILSLSGTDLFERSIMTGFGTMNLGAIALDPVRERMYVGGWMQGRIHAVDCQDPGNPSVITTTNLQHTTHRFTIYQNRLWAQRFRKVG